MSIGISRWRGRLLTVVVLTVVSLAFGGSAEPMDFDAALARVDEALRKNPSRVLAHALESCRDRRDVAVRLYDSGQEARAMRSLEYCFQVLKVSEEAPPPEPEDAPPTPEEIQAAAARELEKALHLEPDLDNGLQIYRSCAGCHLPEGWGLRNGSVPQIAGQHRTVVIKQLADIRAGNRPNFLMLPYASVEAIGGTQAVADVAGYIDTLEILTDVDHGPGDDLELGERLYRENCARCHGDNGQGNAAEFVPRIHAQHFRYLVKQFDAIRDGTRQNANPEMVEQIQGFDERETRAVLDYVSRLEPPPELQAPPGWHNPDFAR